MKQFRIMPKISLLLWFLLAISSCHNMHHRLGIIADEKKETESSTHEAWFASFVDATDNAQGVHAILELGRQHQYLEQCVAWEDDVYTPLHYAAQAGKLTVVKELIEQLEICVDIKTDNYQRTPLHLAALEGHKDVVSFLVKQKADWRATDKDGSNALHYAASGTEGKANTAVVQYLIEKGADPVTLTSGFDLLYLAIGANNDDLVRYIVQKYPNMASTKYEAYLSPSEFARATGKRIIADIIDEAIKNTS